MLDVGAAYAGRLHHHGAHSTASRLALVARVPTDGTAPATPFLRISTLCAPLLKGQLPMSPGISAHPARAQLPGLRNLARGTNATATVATVVFADAGLGTLREVTS